MKNQNSDDSYHAFLESLKGKVVTIYRGGPESKTGQLLDVQSDYVTLYAQNNNNNNNNNNQKNNNTQNNNQQNNQNDNNQNTVVYYQAKHVKSISEDTMTNSTQTTDSMPQEVPFLVADNFASLIANLQDETVQINQGGPESKYGTLLGVTGDFMVLYTEDDGVVYFNLDHVKSVSEYQDNNSEDEDDQNNDQQSEIVYPEILEASNFHNVFSHMAHKWVSINRGGPEAMEGVLVENSGGHYTLVSNQEVLRIHPYHIRSISAGAKGSYSQNNQNNNNQDNQNDNANNKATNNDTENKANDNNKSESNEKDSQRSHNSNRSNREKVVKTIDYVWLGKK